AHKTWLAAVCGASLLFGCTTNALALIALADVITITDDQSFTEPAGSDVDLIPLTDVITITGGYTEPDQNDVDMIPLTDIITITSRTLIFNADILSVPGGSGMVVNVSDVTIDLGGHSFAGAPGSKDGIIVLPGCRNVRIVNGTISGWGGDGITVGDGSEVIISNCTIESCGGNGVTVHGKGCIVEASTISNCGETGVFVGPMSHGTAIVGNRFAGPFGWAAIDDYGIGSMLWDNSIR
ncbi:MAG: right-handed parallel beta-helix repeat-containing protein, partial [Planctomycetota bacterium]